MDQNKKQEIRELIQEANLAIHRNEAVKVYELLNRASFIAGTCAIEKMDGERGKRVA